jgi:GTPase SAR1 family protein
VLKNSFKQSLSSDPDHDMDAAQSGGEARIEAKVVVLGETNVGKTCMVLRWKFHPFTNMNFCAA